MTLTLLLQAGKRVINFLSIIEGLWLLAQDNVVRAPVSQDVVHLLGRRVSRDVLVLSC